MAGIGNERVTFRCPPDLLDAIRERRRAEEADGEVARRDVERYYATLSAELARLNLSAEEAALICDSLNGFASRETDPDLLSRAWWINVEDHVRINDADRKWGVEKPAVLVAKLRALSPGASMAILDAVERWWMRDRATGETIPESLLAVGLIRALPESVAWELDGMEDAEGEEWKA